MTALGSRVTMTHRCSILRNAGTSNSWGGNDSSFAVLASSVPCRAWIASNTLLVEPAEVSPVASYHVALPPDTDVTTDDMLGPVTLRGALVLAGPAYQIDNLVRWPDRIELVITATGA